MRLLKTTKSQMRTFEIEEFTDEQLQNQPYAILSHTWGPYEVTLQDINDPTIKSRTGYEKIEQCCSIAHGMGYEYVWIDTCCIDKTSSAELSEAINSMFLWYQEATICYAYLFDIPQKPFEQSRWFTRGWTLQELIAPREMLFFDKDWKRLGDKASLRTRISQCTRIPESILSGEKNLDSFSIAQRMSWAAERQTSRVEDRAYCLMGLFGVNMPLIYGEREAAFIRLQEEILRVSEDHSLFAWKSPDTRAGLLATSPAAFTDSHDIVPCEAFDTSNSPLIISGRGIHLDLYLIALEHVGLGLAVLQCKKVDGGSTSVAIFVRDPSLTLERFKRVYCDDFCHLNLKEFNTSQRRMTRMCIQSGRMARFQPPTDSEEYDIPTQIHLSPISKPVQIIDWNSPSLYVDIWSLLTQNNPGAGLNEVYNGRTPLSWAAENGLENYVSILLKRGATTEVDDQRIDTPLSLASRNGHTAIVKLLLDKGANINAEGEHGWTPLIHAIHAADVPIIKILIDKGADINTRDSDYRTPLIHAIRANQVSIAQTLIDKGADVNMRFYYGRSPLSIAITRGLNDIVKLLLENGADIETENKEDLTPLALAISRLATDKYTERYDIVEMLILKGADINKMNKYSRSPLSIAITRGLNNIVKLLLENGADIEIRSEKGLTPLVLAISRLATDEYAERHDIVKMLILKGADINKMNKYSRSPLSIAITKGLNDIVKLLLENGADIEARNHRRLTPLMVAICAVKERPQSSEAVDIVKMLILYGADINAKDEFGETPLSIAIDQELKDIVNLLLDKGAIAKTKRQKLMARLARKSQQLF
ncbi:hypothetical protein ABOM_003855 [Aspergillus bombycis]|uniref:Uncharacterized protein n=1 Tax=Aspergillus bombycis TaxID=109264 RepID=A0A1F8A6I8_9EURO|nr:hypothetical protein ABOM_003855 [Aspergillus bombycis]OGM47331.1 hypothetical protein ABOM_003855 [Aspergillus bombycis]